MTEPRDSALFLPASDIALMLLGKAEAARFRSIATVLEREGFPPPDPMFGGRYYLPAVRAWLDRRYGLADAMPLAPGGKEDFSWQRKKQSA